MKEMEALVDTCMADYDENGWTGDTWLPPLEHGQR
jgi:4-hydroxyphenylacetate 3-monooxygenase